MSDAGVVLSESTGLRVRNLLVVTQGAFFLCLAVCVAISHGRTAEADGISYYGVHATTIPFAVAGFAAASVGLWRTAWYFGRISAPALTVVGLRVVALGLPLLLLTPFNRGAFLNWSHMTIGVVMALTQLAITARLLGRRRSLQPVIAFLVQLGGGILGAVSLPDWHFVYLLQGETIYQVGFCWGLIEWVYELHELPRARR